MGIRAIGSICYSFKHCKQNFICPTIFFTFESQKCINNILITEKALTTELIRQGSQTFKTK